MCYGMDCSMEDYMGNCTARTPAECQCPPTPDMCMICKFKDQHTDDCLRIREGDDCIFYC